MNGLFENRGIAITSAAAVAAASAYYFLVYKSNNGSAGFVQTNTRSSAEDYAIKLPKTIDPDAKSRTKLLQVMESLDKKHPKLLKRAFFESRIFNPVAVRLLQFNMLAEGLSSEPDFGGFTQTPVDSLDFHKFRKFRVLKELLRYNADIIAIEECDHFDDFFLPALKLHGYDGRFFPKRNATTLKFGADKFSDGVALVWNTKSISLKEIDHMYYESDTPGTVWSQVGVIGRFERGHCGRTFLVAATHLKAKAKPENEERRVLQARQLLDKLDSMKRDRENVVVMGDFNTEPIVEYYDKQCTYDMIHEHPLKLKSAYKCRAGSEPPYTTCKIRKNGETCHTIDYIFIPVDSIALSTLEIPELSSLPESRLPGYSYPSDHLAIGCDVLF